jgi:glycine cleavage system H protein
VVYVELPNPLPISVSAGDSIGAVESVKSASDINSPISCDIVEVNTLLEEKPGTINRAPEDGLEGGGWIAKIQVSQEAAAEMDALMDDAAYKEFTESE